MKTLHLLRHAKSSRDDPAMEDIDRPLTGRGLNDCALMAEALSECELYSPTVLCSPARRCRDTLDTLQQFGAIQAESVQYDPALYTFNYSDLLDYLAGMTDDPEQVLLIGHNPALTELCNFLGDSPIDNLPTCGYVCIELPVDSWNLGNEHRVGSSLQFLYPGLYR